MGYTIELNAVDEPFVFLLVLAVDHITGATGKSPTVTISKNGGAFATPVGAVTEMGSGWYKVAASLSDRDTAGPLVLHATAASCDPSDDRFDVVDLSAAGAVVRTALAVSPTILVVTAQDLISRALKLIGVLAAGETLGSDDAVDGLDRLNEIIDTWKTQPLTMAAILRTVTTLTTGVTTYTIGLGGAINIDRPDAIDDARLVQDTGATYPIEVPVAVLSLQQWRAVPQKTLTGAYPWGIYYDRDWIAGLGQLSIYGIPTTSTTQLVLYTRKAVASFASLTGQYSFAPGAVKALRYALAKELAPEYGRPWTDTLAQDTRDALADFKRPNMRHAELVSPFMHGRPYNIETDSY